MNFTNLTFFVFVLAIKTLHFVYCVNYVITDASGMGRQFDGIGGISGGGATSKLLVNYPKQQRNEILDLLFKPNFAASLQIFKVEIGGDGESTDGTESSHMHEPWDEDYSRGYEWWMMREAKQRNPEIKLYGLPWSFPGWLGSGKEKNPYKKPERLANYVLKWVQGAHRVYNFTVDYLGIWNEKKYDATYIKTLRHVLDKNGYSHIRIVASDDGWEVANDMLKDSQLNQAVDIIGTHYMGTRTTVEALLTEKPLWSSEDYSTVNNDVGTGCWARLLNQNYVQGFMTSTISWNVLASYYNDLPYGHDGLMTAVEPWSGHYDITNTIWATAHTTQFTEIGWTYLKHGYGTGFLEKGGSYVSLTCSCHKQLTIIIETMSHNHSLCIRPALPPYSVEKQNITYNLQGNMANITTLNVWYSKLNFDGKNDTIFQQLKPIKIIDGTFSFEAEVDAIYTITTVNRGAEMPNTDIPPSKTFPLPYTDNFESYEVGQEAFNFVPQTGVWEVRKTTSSKHTQVNRQVLLQAPVKWCESSPSPINVGGDFQWSNITTSVDIFIPSVNGTTSVFVATRVDKGGCDVAKAKGIFCHLSVEKQSFIVTTDVLSGDIITGGPVTIKPDAWYTLQLTTQGDNGKCSLNGHQLAAFKIVAPQSTGHGFVAYGTGNFHVADFDNFQVTKSKGEIHPYEFHVV